MAINEVLERAAAVRARPARPAPSKLRGWFYVWSIMAVSAALLGVVGLVVNGAGHTPLLVVAVIALAALPAVQMGGTVVHLALRAVLRPSAGLPGSNAVPTAADLASTCLVYPVIVYDAEDIDALATTMGQSRTDSGEGFAAHVALVDFADSRTPRLDTDAELRAQVEAALADASRSRPGPPLLALFRARRWNSEDWMWMGWERKRGKLLELADLVEGSTTTSFVLDSDGDRAVAERLRGVRFAITLDVGNRLLDGGARRLVAAITHPSNRPVVDPQTGRVSSGFGFVRPCHVPARPRTVFEWAWRPYVSPGGQASFGQQMFGQDLFLGQGIFDVSAFRTALAGQIPENTVLSHDKLEGMHIGAACIASAVVVEGNVDDYLAYRERCHRWIRGDVHLLPWIVGRGRPDRRSLPMLARWMLFSDIVDHLWPVSILALLTVGWLAAPATQVGVWTLAVVALLFQAVVVLPLMVMLGRSPRRPGGLAPPGRLKAQLAVRGKLAVWLAGVESLRAPFWIALLADRAILAAGAAMRALYRTAVSNQHVLQWTSSARTGRGVGPGPVPRWRRMSASCALSVALGVLVGLVNPAALPWAAPLLALWLLGPQIAYVASQPARRLPFASLSGAASSDSATA